MYNFFVYCIWIFKYNMMTSFVNALIWWKTISLSSFRDCTILFVALENIKRINLWIFKRHLFWYTKVYVSLSLLYADWKAGRTGSPCILILPATTHKPGVLIVWIKLGHSSDILKCTAHLKCVSGILNLYDCLVKRLQHSTGVIGGVTK